MPRLHCGGGLLTAVCVAIVVVLRVLARLLGFCYPGAGCAHTEARRVRGRVWGASDPDIAHRNLVSHACVCMYHAQRSRERGIERERARGTATSVKAGLKRGLSADS